MADVIHKYGPLSAYTGKPVKIQGKPVFTGFQDDQVFVWCRKSADIEDSWSKVRLVATGESYTGAYVGTVVYPSGYVFHVIEVL